MAAGSINALIGAQRNASVIDRIANPPSVNPLAGIQAGADAAKTVMGVRALAGQQAWGEALQQATDPTSGRVDYGKAQSILAQDPRGTLAMQGAATDSSGLMNDQVSRAHYQMGLVHGIVGGLPDNASRADITAALDRLGPLGISPTDLAADKAVIPTDDKALPGFIQQFRAAPESGPTQLNMRYGTPGMANVGGAMQPYLQAPANQGAAVTTAPGAVPLTLTPTEAATAVMHYPATQDDVNAGRAKEVGQTVFVSGADMTTRFGMPGLVPAGAVVDNPAIVQKVQGRGGGGGAGVTNSDGTKASPTTTPRLLPTRPATTAAPAAAAPIVTPSTGLPTAQPPPTAGFTLPPITVPPAAFGGPGTVPAETRGLVVPPGATLPPPAATAPEPGATYTPPAFPLGASNALQPGVQVASAAPGFAPSVGAPGAPGPAVPGDVAAMMTGVNAAQGGAPAVRLAGNFPTVAVGPGTATEATNKASADKLASDDVDAANFQATQFPYVQALKNYGEGTVTGPTTDLWNQIAGTIRTPLKKLGVDVGDLNDTTERVDALGKWLANIQASNPVSAKSDAELAQVLKGSASTHINETIGVDMVKAGLTLQRMKLAANLEWHNNPDAQKRFGTYLAFLSSFNNSIDPRALSVDMLNDKQKSNLLDQISKGSEADAQRFENTLALGRRNGVIGGAGSQAMP